MRTRVVILLGILIVAVAACAVVARRSKRPLASDVSLLLFALLPPMVGNFIIILSGELALTTVGSFIYFLGIDFTVAALLAFSAKYCGVRYRGSAAQKVVYALVAVDVVQLLLNPVFGHAFALEAATVEGAPYYALHAFAGQTFHRMVAYGIFFASVGMFVCKTATSKRLYRERYGVILLVMVFTGAWETYYIFSGAPIDRSMVGFGMFGLLVFYFSLFYRPMRLLDRMLSNVVGHMDEGLLFFDLEGACVYSNDSALRMLGLDGEDLGRVRNRLVSMLGVEEVGYIRESALRKTVAVADEERCWQVHANKLADDKQQEMGTYVTLRDVTEDERQLERERFLATHDPLTGLYNKEHLYSEARRLIDANPDREYRVVGVDIKEFKIVNDIFSKEFGDVVLRSLADDMRKMAVEGEVYGRISGDKFGMVIPADEMAPDAIERRLRTHVLNAGDVNHPIVIHMGVYEVAERDLPVSVMFDRAFMALASIKNDFQRHVAVYDDEMREKAIWSQSISTQLEEAMATHQIRPYLQPMVDSQGNVQGAEVLVRWIHPKEGFLSPARFIPVFEENGMVATLDVFMWECACKLLKEWDERGIDLFLSVNISPKDFYFIDVYGEIRGLVEKYGVDPSKLRLEITETVMMSDLENRLKIIEDLRSDGFLVEMDDFGSGYSSLNMLKDIPVDVLKIDMMFLYKTKNQGRAETILQTIINLSDSLGIPSITEGVETADQLNMLVNMGCNLFQGYYFAKPMPVGEFEQMYAA